MSRRILTLALLLAAPWAFGADDLPRLEHTLQQATESYHALDLEDAMELLTRIVEDPWAAEHKDAARHVLSRAYELRAACYFNDGKTDTAREDFLALVKIKPDHAVDSTLPSRAAELFGEVRAASTARLTVKSDPIGAVVYLNGAQAGATPIEERYVLAGEFTLRVEREGFKPHEQALALEAGKDALVEAVLTPTHRTAVFFTSPSGVEVRLGDEVLGQTSGLAGAEYAEMAAAAGLRPEDISSPFTTPPLPEGSHRLRFERACYDSKHVDATIRLDETARQPQVFAPIVLSRSVAELEITSEPPGLEVSVDGQAVGTTPFRSDGICSGERLVAVSDGRGAEWFEAVAFTKGASVSLKVKPRPTLRFYGVFREGTMERHEGKSRELGDALRALGKFNFDAPAGALSVSAGDALQNALDSASGRSERPADMHLAALDRGHETRYFLTANPGTTPDSFADKAALWAALEGEIRLFTTSLGMDVMDVRFAEGAAVYRVAPGGPASKAAIKPGAVVTAVNGKAVRSSAEFRAAAEALAPGAAATVSLKGAGDASVMAEATPILLDAQGGFGLAADARQAEMLQKASAEFRFIGRTSRDKMERNAALMNLGVLLLRLNLPDAALKTFYDVDIPADRAGIGTGTLQYLFGLAHLKGGNASSAHEALQGAAKSKATLESDFGPPAAPLAERLLEFLR